MGGIIGGDIDRLGILMERIMWEGQGVEVGNGEGMRWEGKCWDLELIGGVQLWEEWRQRLTDGKRIVGVGIDGGGDRRRWE